MRVEAPLAAGGGRASPSPPGVLYIAGANRSGTTLLERVLAAPEPFFAAGELHHLWTMLAQDLPCGCERPIRGCPFWGAVREEAFDRDGPGEWEEIRELQRRYLRSRPLQIARVLRQDRWNPQRGSESAIGQYAALIERLYAAIRTVSRAPFVVDSSKSPHYADLVARRTRVAPYLIHLVRDPRAVAYSWSLVRANPMVPGGLMPRHRPLAVGLRWLAWNSIAELLLRPGLGERYRRVTYEQFSRNPLESSREVYRFMDLDLEPEFAGPGDVHTRPGHAIGGNPAFHGSQRIVIRPDLEWQANASRSTLLLATAPALPLLRRYGYPVRSHV